MLVDMRVDCAVFQGGAGFHQRSPHLVCYDYAHALELGAAAGSIGNRQRCTAGFVGVGLHALLPIEYCLARFHTAVEELNSRMLGPSPTS